MFRTLLSYPPPLGTTSRAPPQSFFLGMVLRHYLKPSRTVDWTIKDKRPEICRVHAPRAPHPPRHRMGDTTGHQDNTRVVEPASLRRHILKGRMKSCP